MNDGTRRNGEHVSPEHISDDQLIRALDGELPSRDRILVELHVAECAECSRRLDDWNDLSDDVSRAMEAAAVAIPRQSRERLMAAFDHNAPALPAVGGKPSVGAGGRRWRGLAWASGLAATLALGWMISAQAGGPAAALRPALPAAPAVPNLAKELTPPAAVEARVRDLQPVKQHTLYASAADSSNAPFIALPYSSSALPTDNPAVMRVRMRLSELAGAGVVNAPVTTDSWVQADVLLGADGEPRGIRLVQAAYGK